MTAFTTHFKGKSMKILLVSACAATIMLASGSATASADLANANCGKCHEMDKKKKGPSWKTMSAKYKGKPDAEAAALKATTDPNGDHPEFKAKPEDTKAVIKWMLTL
jgi:cytochrome c